MKDIVIIRHVAYEGPGYFSDFLDRQGLTWKLVRVDAGEPIPNSVAGFGGLVLMGGLMSVNDPLPWIPDELNLARKALDSNLPVLGHCLGGQMIAKALGAEITENPVQEFGWHPIRCERATDGDHWLTGLPDEFDAFHWHGETFALPEGAHHLFSNQWCKHQGFSYGNTLALQCHVEMTDELIGEWVARANPGELNGEPSSPTGETILAQTPDKLIDMQKHADILYTRWLQGLNA
jgi:GMP synthase-like glutamine amidotransferase